MLKITICMEQTISQSSRFLCPIKEEDNVRGEVIWKDAKWTWTGSHSSCVMASVACQSWVKVMWSERKRDSSWECVRWPINSWRPWNTSYTLFILAYIIYRHRSVNHTTSCHVSLPILLWKGNRKSTLPVNSIPPQYGVCTSWEGPPYGDLWPRTCRLL